MPAKTPRRRRRILLRSLAVLLGLVAIVLLAIIVLAANLDHPWVKRRVKSLIADAGLEVEYAQAEVRVLGGARIGGLIVRSGGSELLRAGSVEAEWSLGGRRIRDARLRDVVVTLVAADDVPQASPAPAAAAARPEPLSHRVAELLKSAPPIDRLTLDGVTLILVRPHEQAELRGVSARLATHPWRVELGSQASPLDLELAVHRDGADAGSARARVWLSVNATASQIDAALDAHLVKQTLAPAAGAVDHLLHLEASARFDPHAGLSEISVTHGSAADGAASFDAAVELADSGGASVRHAQGELDLDRLLALVPPGWAPLTLHSGRLHYTIEQLLLGAVPRLGEHGAVGVEGEIAGLALPGTKISSARVRLKAHPEGHAWSGDAELRFGAVSLPGVEARDGHVQLRAQKIAVDPAEPLAVSGKLELSGQAANLDLRRPHFATEGVHLSAHTQLSGHAPYSVELDVPIDRLRQFAADGRLLGDLPVHVTLAASELQPDFDKPVRSRGKLHLTATLGALNATLDAKKETDAVDFSAGAEAASLAAARLILGNQSPWERMSLQLRSTGRVERLASPQVRHVTEVHLGRPAFHDADGSLAADELALVLRSSGTAQRHSGDAELRLRKLVVGDTSVGDAHLTTTLALDLGQPSVKLKLTGDGQAGPSGEVSANLSFDRAHRVVHYDLEGKLAKLALLAPLVAKSGVDPTQLDLALSATGTLGGVIRDIGADGTPRFEPHPMTSFAPEAKIHLAAHKLSWELHDREVDVPSLEWRVELRTAGEKRTVHSELELGQMELDVGEHEIDLAGVKQIGEASLVGDLARGDLEITQQLAVRALTQDFAPSYPVGELSVGLEARRDRDGLLRVTKLALDNHLGGTALTLRGALEIVDERRRLAMRGDLTQDLARLSKDPRLFAGSGNAALSLRVSSANLKVFRTLASVKVSGVSLKLPRAGVSLESVDGEIPLGADVALGAHGVTMLRDADPNPYSELRFTDQHPMLSQRSYLSVARVTTPVVSIAPLAGNLKIQQNIISLSQLEMGIRGGRVTGQLVVDYDGAASTVQAHVRASGVQSSHGEPFDGNAAMVFSARDRSLDGRADILRIGRRHLYDLLDVQDPHRADASINRIRRGLSLGYPDRVRLSFNRGFASVKVTFGGLARLISVDEIRGIPIGPLIDKLLAKISTNEDEE